ncbi:MAG TPA: hypothetical protein VED01_26640 [Burkholderiales bacterium]|nr:hypothetical protein [Burkholderiales bacterium]
MTACPHCKRRSFERRDLLYAAIDGAMRCRDCGKMAQLDLFSRWVISIMIAVCLPGVLLYGQVFYSGHFFVISMILVLGGWRLLSCIGLPFFALEAAPDRVSLRPKQSAFVLAVLLTAGSVMDGFMSARFETSHAIEQADAPEAVPRDEPPDPLRIRPRDEREQKAAKFAL